MPRGSGARGGAHDRQVHRDAVQMLKKLEAPVLSAGRRTEYDDGTPSGTAYVADGKFSYMKTQP